MGTVYKPLSYEDRLFYDDERFSVQRPTNSREWNLRIENVRHADTGTYRCTVNTSPPRSKVIHLYVKGTSRSRSLVRFCFNCNDSMENGDRFRSMTKVLSKRRRYT